MKSHSTYSRSKTTGFTLIEVMIVMGILAVIISSGLAFSFDSYRGYLFRSEYTSAINMLAKARNRALNNFNESAHAFSIEPNEYRIYAVDEYDDDDASTYEAFPRNPSLAITSAESTFEFEQLSGNSATCSPSPCTITFSNGLVVKTITINRAGGIIDD